MDSKAFKALMIRKLANSNGLSSEALAKEIGISCSSLYRWVKQADTVDVIGIPDPPTFSQSMQRMSAMKRIRDLEKELRRKDKALAEAAA